MPSVIYLVPVARRVGLTSVSVGLVHALDRDGVAVAFCKPIAQMSPDAQEPERSSQLVRSVSSLSPPEPLPLHKAEELVRQGQEDRLLEEVVDRFEQAAVAASVVIVEGLTPSGDQSLANRINARAAGSLDASVVLVAEPGVGGPERLREILEVAARPYGGVGHDKLLGCILNLVNAPLDETGALRFDLSAEQESLARDPELPEQSCPLYDLGKLSLLACIPWDRRLLTPRVRDVVRFNGADIVNAGNQDRRISHVALVGRGLAGACDKVRQGALVITPGDRSDVLLAVSMAALNGTHIAALLFTDGTLPDARMMALCRPGMATGLPLLSVPYDLLQSVLNIPRMDLEVPLDDDERIQLMTSSVAGQLDLGWVHRLLAHGGERRMSPPAFRHLLVERARNANKRIVLPEGDEPRTIEAAVICHHRGIARCVLLGRPERIASVAASRGVSLPADLEIIDPESIRQRYVAPMVERRRHKNLTPAMAEEQLLDPVAVGTMMLVLDEVDGLVSGAVHTTANTIRPALQLIRTAPGAGLVSSVFFMCLPGQVLVYGDCAVNPDPNAEQLANIAIQSAESALAFGITPRVAMLSYSTGGSGGGQDVEKVKEATRIARSLRPDLSIDGPLQYDAATIESVAHAKAPGSEVAGRATVFVFPDLNTGNTTYKAVQRSASVISIGPMLQGLAKPVNDLSRGALVEDIVFTIALTAIQATRTGARKEDSPSATTAAAR